MSKEWSVKHSKKKWKKQKTKKCFQEELVKGIKISLKKNNVDEGSNFDEDDRSIIDVALLAWHSNLEKYKALKKEMKN